MLTFGTAVRAQSSYDSCSDRNPFIRILFAFGLVFLFPSFIYQLAVNIATGEFTGSRILQAANLGCAAYSLIMIITSRRAVEVIRRCTPLTAIVCLAFVSTAWSYNPGSSFQASTVLLSTTLFGAAIATRLSAIASLELIVRTMAFGCLLSIVWVAAFPQLAVHQLTDAYQTVHAGLWRGIFSHKQGLGVFAGLTTGLVLFYGSIAFPMPLVRLGAIACGIACLIGSQSVTGILTAGVTAVMLYTTYWIATQPRQRRGLPTTTLVALLFSVFAIDKLGLLDFIPGLLGKSSDLSGRADLWPYVLTAFSNSGSTLLGGGFASDYVLSIAPGVSVDNGYIDKLVEFGYVGATILFVSYGRILWAGLRLMMSTAPAHAATAIFPLNITFVIMFINITESNLMSKNIGTVLIAMAACQVIGLPSGARTGETAASVVQVAARR